MKAHLQKAWEELKAIYYEHLEEYGVKLPAKGTAKQIWLAMLYDSYKKNPAQLIDKGLGPMKFGGNFVEISRRYFAETHRKGTKRGFHCLDPYKPSPSFAQDAKRKAKILAGGNFETIKQEYGYS